MKLLFMNATELRTLDAWIAENVMGWIKRDTIHKIEGGDFAVQGDTVFIAKKANSNFLKEFHPTTDPAASDALDDKILEWCFKNNKRILVWKSDAENYCIKLVDEPPFWFAIHSDKKICRAMFAKKLFEK